MLVAPAAAEPVQTSLTVDANTTALYLFKEGTGTTSACESQRRADGRYQRRHLGARTPVLRRGDRFRIRVNERQRARCARYRHHRRGLGQAPAALGDLVCKNGSYFFTARQHA